MLERWGRIVTVHARWVLISAVAVGVAAVIFGLGAFNGLSQGGFADPDSESAKAAALERAAFTNSDADVVVDYSSDTQHVTDPGFKRAVTDVVDRLPPDAVTQTSTYYQTRSPDLISNDRRSTMVVISLAGD